MRVCVARCLAHCPYWPLEWGKCRESPTGVTLSAPTCSVILLCRPVYLLRRSPTYKNREGAIPMRPRSPIGQNTHIDRPRSFAVTPSFVSFTTAERSAASSLTADSMDTQRNTVCKEQGETMIHLGIVARATSTAPDSTQPVWHTTCPVHNGIRIAARSSNVHFDHRPTLTDSRRVVNACQRQTTVTKGRMAPPSE